MKRLQMTSTLSISTEKCSMVLCMPCNNQILSKNENLKIEDFCKGRPFDFQFRVGIPVEVLLLKWKFHFFKNF